MRNRGRTVEGLGSVFRKCPVNVTKVIRLRNLVAQVRGSPRRTVFAHVRQHFSKMHYNTSEGIHIFQLQLEVDYQEIAMSKEQRRSLVCQCVTYCKFSVITQVWHWFIFNYLSCSKGWVSPHLWMASPRRHTGRFKLSINTTAQTDLWKSFTEVTHLQVLCTPTVRKRSETEQHPVSFHNDFFSYVYPYNHSTSKRLHTVAPYMMLKVTFSL